MIDDVGVDVEVDVDGDQLYGPRNQMFFEDEQRKHARSKVPKFDYFDSNLFSFLNQIV